MSVMTGEFRVRDDDGGDGRDWEAWTHQIKTREDSLNPGERLYYLTNHGFPLSRHTHRVGMAGMRG